MKALELLKQYQYADDCLDGLMAEELNEAITELEALESKLIECMERYTDLEFKLICDKKNSCDRCKYEEKHIPEGTYKILKEIQNDLRQRL